MLIGGLSVRENIELGLQASGEDYVVEDIAQLIDKVGLLKEYIDKKVSKLSGGEKQRVSIARAIAKKQAMIFADEPTGNLDRRNGEKVMDILKDISKERLVVVVSHNEKFNAKYADYTIELLDGMVKNCDLPLQDEEKLASSNDIPQRQFDSKNKLRPKTVLRLANWGFEKNKGKTVVSIIAFIVICVLCVLFTSATINDYNLAYAYSLNSCKGKNVIILSDQVADKYRIDTFKDELGVKFAEVYSFAIRNIKLDEQEEENFNAKYAAAPSIGLGMAYDQEIGVDVEILYGDFPKNSNDAMLPYSYAQYLAKVSVDYKCEDLNNLIGKEFKAYDQEFEICGIFEDGPYFTDYATANEDEIVYFVEVNKMAQCVILASDMQDFLYDLSYEDNYFNRTSFMGFYFNMKKVNNVYFLFHKIQLFGWQLNFWNYEPMKVRTENIYFSADISDILHSLKYFALLPLTLFSLICMVAMGYVSLSYILASKTKQYNILRMLGFEKKSVALVLFVQIFTVIAIECLLGISLGALGCHIFGKVYAYMSGGSAVAKLSRDIIFPMGYGAPIIVVFVSLLLGGAIVFAKTRSLFKKSVIENKTN